jgi:Spy/CpxP family protein refolding chaperone
MKGTFLALALMCATGVYAQTTAAPANASAREAQMMSDLATLLDLTEAQKPQVQAILQAQHAQMKQMFEQARSSGTEPDFAQMKAAHQQLEQETLQKLSPVLSPGQLAKFQILTKMMHGPHMHFHGGAPPAQN